MKSLCPRSSVSIPGAAAYPLTGTWTPVIQPPPAPFDALVAAGITVYALHGFRRGLLSHSGATCRVRRGSDNLEREYAAPLSAEIATWCGGATAYLVREHDQMGGGRDLYQPTPSLQPVIDLSGTYPVAVYNGIEHYMLMQNALGWPRARAGMAIGSAIKPAVANDKTRAISTWMAPDGVNSSGAVQATLDMGNSPDMLRFVVSRITGDATVSLATPIVTGAWQSVVAGGNYTTGEAFLRNGGALVTGLGLTTGVTGNVDSAAGPWSGRHRNAGREFSGAVAASVWVPQALTAEQSLALANALSQMTSA